MNYYQRPQRMIADRCEPGRPRRWTADELGRLDAEGFFAEGEHVELIAGEIMQMAAKGNRHEVLRTELTLFWIDHRAGLYKIASEPPLRLGEHDEPEPDLIIYRNNQTVAQVTAASVLLVVEVADSSLSYDLKIKAPVYASFGVREYWVIDPNMMATYVHRKPGQAEYAEVTQVAAGDLLTPHLAPELAVRLADLGIGPEAGA